MSEPKRHIYESTTLGMPPLKMVLVHARNEAQNSASHTHVTPAAPAPAEESQAEKERVVRRIIERLQELD